ncbi:MAG: NfeD family protein, partial [Planctomycetota bacterium]
PISVSIGDEIKKRGVNWIGLRIDSGGGDMESCLRLADSLASLDSREVRTVAYVPGEAAGGAAVVALACDQLIMHEGAYLGGGFQSVAAKREPPAGEQENDDAAPNGDAGDPPNAEDAAGQDADPRLLRGPGKGGREPGQRQPPPDPKPAGPGVGGRIEGPGGDRRSIDAAVTTIESLLAKKTDHTASLLAAMIDPDIRVFRYTHQETAAERLFTEQEAADQPDAAEWRPGAEITRPGESLRLTGGEAEELGVAWRVVESYDELAPLYGFGEEPRVAKPNWALELVEALRSRQFAMLLLMVGFVGVYIELNTPGVGVGGFIAAVAFVLFFWSRFTNGTADWLEVMLFITGVLCILLELLVLPGVGIFGFGGALLVLTSLILAGQTFILPKTPGQIAELRASVATVAGAFAAMIVFGVALRMYLPQTTFFKRMQLAPVSEADRIEQERREAVADYAYLVGRTGVATTDLLPSGKADFEGELVDVIADGGIIDRGAEVTVVSTRANRVMVRGARA